MIWTRSRSIQIKAVYIVSRVKVLHNLFRFPVIIKKLKAVSQMKIERKDVQRAAKVQTHFMNEFNLCTLAAVCRLYSGYFVCRIRWKSPEIPS